MHLAALHNAVDAVRTLADHGAEISGTDSEGRTCLHLAAGSNAKDAVHVLIEYGAGFTKDKSENTPLDVAERMDSWCTSKLLTLLDTIPRWPGNVVTMDT